LVLDDASTNKDLAKKNKICVASFPQGKFIPLSRNMGRTFARNTLALKAKFPYLLFLDADVLPKNEAFFAAFVSKINNAELVFGGVSYTSFPPPKEQLLRWKYGRNREAKSVEIRNKNPYLSIISMAFFIQKKLFFKVNNHLDNHYGLDVLFCENLKKQQAEILHIENPILHLGLETNQTFIKKSKQAMATIARLAKKGTIPKDFRPVQKASKKLDRFYLSGIFFATLKPLLPAIEKNLCSKNPSLVLFDFYRLYYYHKNVKNA